ncbi:MAG: UV excision repair Rad23 [Lasallia pustulata]|uniref:UV excision repair protein RAD23 n=1 Tax=Lasallia pustulata TaxID=136370 RepID=A0A1W5D7A0_9LECA|nr:MAG: UV excision repair Rad23 [Lasallia pustulata]SLM39004.1 uv excision repair protein rad23 [Lasallia pustulata]
MKLTFKDLKQQKFVVEAEPSETIGEVKEKISKEKGWEASQQKLIYSGKILQDANTVESYHIEEKGFIVCMVSKPKAAPASASNTPSSSKAPVTPAPATAQTPVPPAAPAPASNTSAQDVPATSSPTPAAPTGTTAESGTFNDPTALTLGPDRDAAVAHMESMGFPRADIDRAMRAAFFTPDRAVEYLLNGIPENIQQEQQQAAHPPATGSTTTREATSPAPAAAAPGGTSSDAGDQPINLFEAAAQAGRGGSGGRSQRQGASAASGLLREGLGGGAGAGAGGEAAAGGLGNLDFLRTNPQFQQLRQIVQTQPRMLEPILQQVGAGNPGLAQLIGQNPDQFLQLLSEDADEDAPLPPGAQAISVTEEEREAIERLCRLGFERDLVIQAYFACDKNEELAANFLFEQPPEGDDA